MSAAARHEEPSLRERTAVATRNLPVIAAIRAATFRKVDQRAESLRGLHDPDRLRALAGAIKQHTLARLAEYLEQFAANVRARGGHVHFAADGREAGALIVDIARRREARLAVKSKSMTAEEIDLNAALERAGVRVVETDLGEFIVQIDGDQPSHIVTPIIHKNRRDVARAMQREIGCAYTEDPAELTRIARGHLREIFRRCDLGVSGANFAVAESGTLVICTNEGNGRMTTTRPRTHVALVGIEKLIPRLRDLPVFLKLLARSSTGQPLTVYTSMITGPRRTGDVDGPEELHVVLLDNGRSGLLGGAFEDVLRCIRCGACLNACPVYRNVGGHAYASVYPGPIGSLVTPLLAEGRGRAVGGEWELPRASSLCGACAVACPVMIDIPALLIRLRERHRGRLSPGKRAGMRVWSWCVGGPRRYRFAQAALRVLCGRGEDGWARRRAMLRPWQETRDLRAPAARSFRQIWESELRDER